MLMLGLIIRKIQTPTYRIIFMSENERCYKKFEKMLIKQDLSKQTINGYLYDVRAFLAWLKDFYQDDIEFTKVKTNDLQAYREYLVKVKRYKPASINRRIQAIKRFYNWISTTSKIRFDHPAKNIRFMRRGKPTQPPALNKKEIHALLRVSGQSPHGLSKRNYALVQVLLQTGMRVGEIAQLQIRDIMLHDRSGYAKVIDGKGHKSRSVPLNATVRRALLSYFDTRESLSPEDHVFTSKRGTLQSIRGVQKVIQTLAQRAHINRIDVSAHTLRHTFAVNYLKANPGSLVDLAALLGHESLNTTAIYTQPSQEALLDSLERSDLNIQEKE
jgi:site-specific recombinase XerD